MTRGRTLLLLISVAVLSLAVACSSDSEPDSSATVAPSATAVPPTATAVPDPPPSPGPEAIDTGQAGATDAEMRSFALGSLTVPVGASVRWTNTGGTHTSTSGVPGSATGLWDSGAVRQGESFTFTFTEAGTFEYFCSFHPDLMTATITVTAAGSVAQEPNPTATATPQAPTATPVPSTATPVPPTATPVPPTSTPVPPTATPPPPAATNTVTSEIVNFGLETLTVTVGTEVTWTNKDAVEHTTTSGEPESPTGFWDSGSLRQDARFSFTFNEVGSFTYFCAFHPAFMAGTITVVAEGTGEAATQESAPEPVATDIRSFQLETLTVPVGTSLTWTNKDAVEHTTTSGEPESPTGIWDSGSLGQDAKFSFTFNEVGSFSYFCAFHPSFMTGTITVVAGSTSARVIQTSGSEEPESDPGYY